MRKNVSRRKKVCYVCALGSGKMGWVGVGYIDPTMTAA